MYLRQGTLAQMIDERRDPPVFSPPCPNPFTSTYLPLLGKLALTLHHCWPYFLTHVPSFPGCGAVHGADALPG